MAPPVFVLQFVYVLRPLSVVCGLAAGVKLGVLGFLSVGASDCGVLLCGPPCGSVCGLLWFTVIRPCGLFAARRVLGLPSFHSFVVPVVLVFASGSVVLVLSWAGEVGSVVCGFVCCVCYVLHVCIECVVFCCVYGSIYVRRGQIGGRC